MPLGRLLNVGYVALVEGMEEHQRAQMDAELVHDPTSGKPVRGRSTGVARLMGMMPGGGGR